MIYLHIYIIFRVCIYICLILCSRFELCYHEPFCSIVPIYALSKKKTDLFYKKYAIISS